MPHSQQFFSSPPLTKPTNDYLFTPASFPALLPPPRTPFSVYQQPTKNQLKTNPDIPAPTILAGDASAVEFVSAPEETQRARAAGCRCAPLPPHFSSPLTPPLPTSPSYLLALHSPRTRTTLLHPAPLPLHLLTARVKALKNSAPSSTPSALARPAARAALGTAFGTKRARAAIRAEERNKVDPGALGGAVGVLQAAIEGATGGLAARGAFCSSLPRSLPPIPSSPLLSSTASASLP